MQSTGCCCLVWPVHYPDSVISSYSIILQKVLTNNHRNCNTVQVFDTSDHTVYLLTEMSPQDNWIAGQNTQVNIHQWNEMHFVGS